MKSVYIHHRHIWFIKSGITYDGIAEAPSHLASSGWLCASINNASMQVAVTAAGGTVKNQLMEPILESHKILKLIAMEKVIHYISR